MKAIIMAAGIGTRTMPLTESIPKVMLPIANKPLLEYNIEAIEPFVDEIIVVVGHLKEYIINHFMKKRIIKKLRFIEQKEQSGTGGAALLSEHAVLGREATIDDEEPVIIMNGDDLYYAGDIKRISKSGYAILSKKVKDPSKFGILKCDANGIIKEVIEKPDWFVGNLAGIGVYKLPAAVFKYLKTIGKSERDEFELPSAVNLLLKKYPIKAVESTGFWFPLNYPWSLLEANEGFINIASSKWKDSKKPNIIGKVLIGKGTRILPGAYIEGPVVIGKNCKIGPNCYIRPTTSIGDNCHIGNGCEIKNSLIMNNSNVAHLSYVGDSIIGENCNLGAGTIIANLRHDGENVKWLSDGKLIDTGRRKFGAVLSSDVKTGIGTLIYPGRAISAHSRTKPGEIVKENITQKKRKVRKSKEN